MNLLSYTSFLLLLACCSPLFAAAEDVPSANAEKCKVVYCKKRSIHLKIDEKDEINFQSPEESPVWDGGLLEIYPGETIYLEAEIEGGELRFKRAVPEVRDPAQTFIFRFYQRGSGFSKADPQSGMVLEIDNPFSEDIKFNVGMVLPTKRKYTATTSCPVFSKIKLIEHWPHPIMVIALKNGRVLRKDEPRECSI
jgi:hypothetical protein